MTLLPTPFANILCRPGPSAISPLGPDLYAALINPTTNTFLDAFQPRPEDGTILGPRLTQSLEGDSMTVERFDSNSARHIVQTVASSFFDPQNRPRGHFEPAGAYTLKETTQGLWRTTLVGPDTIAFMGPSGRSVHISSFGVETLIEVGWIRDNFSITQCVAFNTDLGRPRTQSYAFRFEDWSLKGLKTLLNLDHGETMPKIALEVLLRIVGSKQYPVPSYDISFDGPSACTIKAEHLRIQGTEDWLAVDLFSGFSPRERPPPDFMPLAPDLRKLLWDGGLAFLNKNLARDGGG